MKRRVLIGGTLGILSVIFLACLWYVVRYYYDGYCYRRDQKTIARIINGGISEKTYIKTTENESTEKKKAVDAINNESRVKEASDLLAESQWAQLEQMPSRWEEQYQALISVNPDCAGYLEISGTTIQLPVMFTPDEPERYLYRDFYGKKEKRGIPFLDKATVLGQSQNYIVYGHNMKDGSVFGTLPSFLERSFCEDHRFIYFNTAVSEGVYEIFAVCKTRVLAKTSEDFKYYQYGGLLSQADFKIYVETIKSMAEQLFEADISWGDELLTLSTCYHRRAGDDGRLIVVAKRIR